MKVTNLRLGFATNSSSAHSIIFDPNQIDEQNDCQDFGDYEFGWDNFVLGSKEAKLGYLAVAVAESLRKEGLTESMVKVGLKEIFSNTEVEPYITKVMDGYIDHQSMFKIAHSSIQDLMLNVGDYINVFADPRIAVYGGNDNVSEFPEYEGKEIILESYGGVNRVKKDGDAIVLFNTKTGAKIRFSTLPYEKSTVPELVDVKITNRCPYTCNWCYQNSVSDGEHAKFWKLNALFEALSELRTFEVALGGGEPTTHPEFCDIVNSAREYGIIPNFSTYGTDWLKDHNKVSAAKLCGGVGVSVHVPKDYNKVRKIKDALPNIQVMAQHVFGTLTSEQTLALLSTARTDEIPVLLLGFKNVGRGVNHDLHNMSKFVGEVVTDMLPKLSVDTAFIERYPEILDKLHINKTLVSPREGAFSMYIDAVAWKAGPSSYCGYDQMSKLHDDENLADRITNLFATY